MHSTYSRNDFSEMKKHFKNQKYDHNVITNYATLNIFIILINYFQDIMIIIFDNNL